MDDLYHVLVGVSCWAFGFVTCRAWMIWHDAGRRAQAWRKAMRARDEREGER